MELCEKLHVLETSYVPRILTYMLLNGLSVKKSFFRNYTKSHYTAENALKTLLGYNLAKINRESKQVFLTDKGLKLAQELIKINGILSDAPILSDDKFTTGINVEFLSLQKLAEYELQTTANEIWLITYDLCVDIPGYPFYEVVENNLQKGIKYKYFVSDNLTSHARKSIVENQHCSDNLHIYELPDDFFFLNHAIAFVIYDPLNVCSKKECWMSLPILENPNEAIHCKLNQETTDLIIGKLQKIYEKNLLC